MLKSLLSCLFQQNELIQVLISEEEVQVKRGGGEMNPGVARDLVVLGTGYNVDAGRFQLRSDATIRRCGVTVSVKEA